MKSFIVGTFVCLAAGAAIATACADTVPNGPATTGPATTNNGGKTSAVQRQALAKPVTTFGYLDLDKDNRLSLKEARADWAVATGFEAADANHDGYLDAEEFKRVGRG